MPKRVPTHKPPTFGQIRPRRSEQRLSDNRFYASTPWRRLRSAFLLTHPLCGECKKMGRDEPARHVHHVKERRDHPELELCWENLQSLCVPCHGSKRKK